MDLNAVSSSECVCCSIGLCGQFLCGRRWIWMQWDCWFFLFEFGHHQLVMPPKIFSAEKVSCGNFRLDLHTEIEIGRGLQSPLFCFYCISLCSLFTNLAPLHPHGNEVNGDGGPTVHLKRCCCLDPVCFISDALMQHDSVLCYFQHYSWRWNAVLGAWSWASWWKWSRERSFCFSVIQLVTQKRSLNLSVFLSSVILMYSFIRSRSMF